MACVTFQDSEPYRSVTFTLEVKMGSLVFVEIDEVFQTGFAYSALHIFPRTSRDCDDTAQIGEAFNIFQFLAVQLDFILLYGL